MTKRIVRLLLAVLNSRWLNHSPCKYGFIGNIDAFSLENLESEERMRPGITVATVLEEAARWRSCLMRKHCLTVMDGAETREATPGDIYELRRSLTPSK